MPNKKINGMIKIIKNILSLPLSMAISFKYLFQNTATIQNPEMRKEILKRFRGVFINDVPRCIFCELCAKVCPVKCIAIKNTRGVNKIFEPEIFNINLVTCLFCGLCTEVCPTECLTMEGGYESAEYDKNLLIAQFVKLNSENQFMLYSKDEGWINYDRAKDIMAKLEFEKK